MAKTPARKTCFNNSLIIQKQFDAYLLPVRITDTRITDTRITDTREIPLNGDLRRNTPEWALAADGARYFTCWLNWRPVLAIRLIAPIGLPACGKAEYGGQLPSLTFGVGFTACTLITSTSFIKSVSI